jgi:hypothetical protein
MVEQMRQPLQSRQCLEIVGGQEHHFLVLARQQAFVGSAAETSILAGGVEAQYCLPLEADMGFDYRRILAGVDELKSGMNLQVLMQHV